MDLLFQNCLSEYSSQPGDLNSITETLLKEVAKEHHPHNRLLPATFIQSLLAEISPQGIVGSNSTAQRYILGLNCLRNVMIANFSQLNDNKMFAAVVMNHAQTLNVIVGKERERWIEGGQHCLRFIARGYLANEIMLKLLQKSHVYIPELLRFASITLEIGVTYFDRLNEEDAEEIPAKELRILSKVGENSKVPKLLLSLGFKKIWKKSYMLILLKAVVEQLQRILTTCGYKKNAMELDLYKQILEKYESFKATLSPSLQEFISPAVEQGQAKENQEVYLQEPTQVRELTPRFYDEQQAMVLTKLRRKKLKLTKKIETDLRKSVIVKQQEAHIRDQVRREKGMRQQKKEQLIIEKQTVEVKKHNRELKKVKMIRKGGKGGDKAKPMAKGMGLGKNDRGSSRGRGASRGRGGRGRGRS